MSGYEALSPALVADQIRAVVTDIGVDAAKTGMLANARIVEAVAEAVAETGIPNLVVDPVFVSKHGHPLLEPDAVDALKSDILPLATAGDAQPPRGRAASRDSRCDSPTTCAGRPSAILRSDPRAVLVKGGHLGGRGGGVRPVRRRRAGRRWISAPRIDTPHTHGTGCTLRAAIAAPRSALRPAVVRGIGAGGQGLR